jgi:muconate cycloisomerase
VKIVRVEAIPFALPLRRVFRWNGLDQDLGNFVLVRITTDSSHVGYGEATPLATWGGEHGRHGGETLETVVTVVERVFAPWLKGRDPTEITATMADLDRLIVGHTYAKCSIDIALHDLWGKVLGMPVHRLLGGVARPSVLVAHMVGLMPLEDAIEEARAACADGFRALQIKGGGDPERDLALIRRLREVLPNEVELRLDANQGYGQVKRALNIATKLAKSGLNYLEQPVAGLWDLQAVTARTNIRIIADESCWSARDALDLARHRSADCISIYLAKAGGIHAARRVAAVAEAADLSCDVNGSIESAIGNAANLAFAIAMRCVVIPSVIPVSAPNGGHPCNVGGHYYDDDVVTQPFGFRDGALLPLDGPGLGIEVDEAKVRKYAL